MSDHLLLAWLREVLVQDEDLPSELQVAPTAEFDGRLVPQIAILNLPVRQGRTQFEKLAERIAMAIDADTQSRRGQVVYLVLAMKDGKVTGSHREVRLGKMRDQDEMTNITGNLTALADVQKAMFGGVRDWMGEMRIHTAHLIGQSGAVNARAERQAEKLLDALLKERGFNSDLFNANLRLRVEAMGLGRDDNDDGSLERLKVQLSGLKDAFSPMIAALGPAVQDVVGAYARKVSGGKFHGETEVDEEGAAGPAPPTRQRVRVSEDGKTGNPKVDAKLQKLRDALSLITLEETMKMVAALLSIDQGMPMLKLVLSVVDKQTQDAIFDAAEGVFHAL